MAASYVARDLSALEKSVNDTAGKVMVLWTSFVTIGAYLLVATGSVKYRDLFLDAAIRLPVLGVDLPVTGYFLVAPLILLIFHFYVLLQLSGLSQKVSDYNLVLNESLESADDRRMARRRLDDFPFLQYLAGVRERRLGIPGALQIAISWITTALFPITLFLQLQIAFLPYHSTPITWLHRLCLIADIVLIWFFWRSYRPSEKRRGATFWRIAAGCAATIAVLFSVFLATFPGEALYRNLVARDIDAVVSFVTRDSDVSASRFLFEGDVDGVTGRPTSLFANRLILPGEHFYDQAKHEKAQVSISLRGRDLRGAILQRADLRLADFTGASLLDASFVGAQLQKANFGCAAKLQLEPGRARPRADDCDETRATDLRGADFSEAYLHGTLLDHAKLNGARFARTMMQGVSAKQADMTAANLMYARAEGAFFTNATMTAASMFQVQMQGADFSGADLSNAMMFRAQLQGAELNGATLTSATVRSANFYRAFIDLKQHEDANLLGVSGAPTFPRLQGYAGKADAVIAKNLDTAGYKEFFERAVESIKDPDVKQAVAARLAVLDPAKAKQADQFVSDKPIKIDPDTAKKITAARAEALTKLACDAARAPYTARGMIFNGRVLGLQDMRADKDSDPALRLIAVLRGNGCPGTAGFEARDWRELAKIERDVLRLKNRNRNRDDDDDDDEKTPAPSGSSGKE